MKDKSNNFFSLEADEQFTGDYTEDICPSCGRHRVMLCQDNKRHCEKCWWCVEDEEYQGEWYKINGEVNQ